MKGYIEKDEDYCFDCKKMIKDGDQEHEEHDRLRTAARMMEANRDEQP